MEPVKKKAKRWLEYVEEKRMQSKGHAQFILELVLDDMFKIKYWCCPICDFFDWEDGVPDETEVKDHILNEHLGSYILDVASASSSDDHNFSHENLMAKVSELKLDPLDYMPLQVHHQRAKSHSGKQVK